MTDYPWFKFDVAQERALMDTMTDEQYGAHMRLRLHSWTAQGLPTHEPELRAIGRWPVGQWKRIWPTISKQWRADGDRLVNDAQEIGRIEVEAKSDDGRKAAAKRWQSKRNADALPPQCDEIRGEGDKTRGDKRESANALSLVTTPSDASELSTGQLRASAPGLYAAWNTVACVAPELKRFEADPPFGGTVQRALHAHPRLDWWAAVFAKVAASDYLRGLKPGRDGTPFVATFWWVLDNAAKIDADQYLNRDMTAMVDPNAASVAAAKLAMRRLMR